MSDYGSAPPPPPVGSGHAQTADPGQASYPPAMPGYEPPAPTTKVPVAHPASIALALKLMYAGAALSLVGIFATILTRDTIRGTVEKASHDATSPMTSTQINVAVGLAIGVGVVSGLIGAALWLWMAAANGRGRKWARIVATVFFGLSVLFTLGSLVQKPPVLSLVIGLVSLLLGACTIVLLYKRESTEFYDGQSAPRY